MCSTSDFLGFLLSFVFESFTFGFVHQLQTAENTILLVMENIFHSVLDGTMILYTILSCFVTETTRLFLHSASLKVVLAHRVGWFVKFWNQWFLFGKHFKWEIWVSALPWNCPLTTISQRDLFHTVFEPVCITGSLAECVVVCLYRFLPQVTSTQGISWYLY